VTGGNELRRTDRKNLQVRHAPKALQFFSPPVRRRSRCLGHALGDRAARRRIDRHHQGLLDFYRVAKIDQLLLVLQRFRQHDDSKGHRVRSCCRFRHRQDELQERWDYIYEPDAIEILDGILMLYIESQIFQGAVENVACEMRRAWWP